MNILVVNAGSSSVKASLFVGRARARGSGLPPDWQAQLSWSRSGEKSRVIESRGLREETAVAAGEDWAASVGSMLESAWQGEQAVLPSAGAIAAVGHRVVHGGEKFSESIVVDRAAIEELAALTPLAPDHQPANVGGLRLAQSLLPAAVQVAVFDTAFHRSLAESARVYAGPYAWYRDRRIQRYGFHGISHAYCARRAGELLPSYGQGLKLVTCHLGSGCSLAAVEGGTCRMTTMGFTPLAGLIMRTRSGTVDPGLLIHLLETGAYSAAELKDILHNQSGLRGISGLSGDMQEIESEMAGGNEQAALAFTMFADSVACHVGMLLPYLGGLDALAFTGGIGEHSAAVREAVCQRLRFLGVQIDEAANKAAAGDRLLSSPGSAVAVLAVACREDLLILSECQRLVDEGQPGISAG